MTQYLWVVDRSYIMVKRCSGEDYLLSLGSRKGESIDAKPLDGKADISGSSHLLTCILGA